MSATRFGTSTASSFGRVWVGLTGGAAEGVTEINLAATKDVLKYSDQEDNALGLETVVNGAYTGLAWRRLIRGGGDQPGEGRRYNMVRYDTPELAGFHGTANWGEDDAWEVGLRYKGEFGDFKVAAGIAYGENSDVTSDDPAFQCVGNDGLELSTATVSSSAAPSASCTRPPVCT